MAIKSALLQKKSEDNLALAEITYQDSQRDMVLLKTTNFADQLVRGSELYLYGDPNGDNADEVIATGYVSRKDAAAGGNNARLDIVFTAADYKRVKEEYPAGSSNKAVKFQYEEGIVIPDGENWTLHFAISGSSDHYSVQAHVDRLGSSDNYYTLLKPGEANPIGSVATEIQTSLTKVDALREKEMLLIYDDGK